MLYCSIGSIITNSYYYNWRKYEIQTFTKRNLQILSQHSQIYKGEKINIKNITYISLTK